MAENYFYSKRTKTIHIYGYCNTKTHGILYPSLKKAMEASENTATMCKKCLEHKEKILAENARIKNEIKQAELAKKRELKERKKLEEEKKKIQEEEQRIRAEAWEKEKKKSETGRAIFLIASFIVGIILTFTVGWLAMLVVFFIAAIIAQGFENKKKYGDAFISNEEALFVDKLRIAQQSNLPPDMTLKLVQKASDEYEQDVINKLNDKTRKKAIVTGAVVGGITGGEIGAAAGAIIANENAKQQQ